MRQIPRGAQWLSACLLIIVAASACASAPPARRVTNVGDIAGKWQGTGSNPMGTGPITTTINPDGSYAIVTPTQGTFTGKISMVDGKLRGRGDRTGTMGTWILHEGAGKRVLTYKSDDGLSGAELTPAR
jgi:hypothetical protein